MDNIINFKQREWIMCKTMERLAKSNKRSGIPILTTLACDKKKIMATDMDFWITAQSALKKGTYHAEGFSKGVQISAEYPTTDFPLPHKTGEKIGGVSLNKKHMDAIDWVSLAQSTEKTRYYLNGMYFGGNQIVATNGHMLNCITIDQEIIKDGGVIFPRTAWKYLMMLCKELKDFDVEIEFYEKEKFKATVGHCVMEGKLIDGTFPDWRSLVPDEFPEENTTFFDVEEMKEIYKQVDVVRKIDKMKTPAIVFDGGFVTPANSFYSVKNTLKWKVEANLTIQIGFNAKYVANSCSGIMQYSDSTSPVLIRDDRRSIKKLSVLMPLSV